MMKCPKCGIDMELQPYKQPYILPQGRIIHNITVDVYICPTCGKELEELPNEEDGYSAGAGLFSED